MRVASLTALGDRPRRRVLNTMAEGPVARQLDGLPNAFNTSFWDDVAPGEERGGVRCEDLTALTFDDASLDLVITEDVLEHVPESERAFAEIARVLRPGGAHVFSVPYRPGRRTERYYDLVDGEPRLQEPVRYHADPIRGRIPVYYLYGDDLLPDLAELGFTTRLVVSRYPDLRRHAIADCVTLVSRRVE